MNARALMVLGTASHVGKSLITAALCRIFTQEGYRVAPFKAQNMSLNSAATPDGLEIGRAQAMQAEAAGISPSVDMNPVLIKPSTDTDAQVVVRGRVWRQVTARDYYGDLNEQLFPLVVESYRRLATEHDIVVVEGAGSPAEINLKEHDIVNMRVAEAADAACILTGDIERGGVFASLFGTLELLEEHERARIRGFLINKFRGDEALLRPGVQMMERRLGKPCVGVVHHLRDIGLEEEDSVTLEEKKSAAALWGTASGGRDRALRIGVVALPYLSNFTDFDALAAEPSVSLAYIRRRHEVAMCDVVIIPGSKQTADDLRWTKNEGIDRAIREHASRGITVGICGGMQMLGYEVDDPTGTEGGGREQGLGLLPINTVLARDKVTVRAQATLAVPQLLGYEMKAERLTGYEIHLGTTAYHSGAAPLFSLEREGSASRTTMDGSVSGDGRTIGTYLHGLFDTDSFRHTFLRAARAFYNLTPPLALAPVTAEKEARFDRLAAHVRAGMDLRAVFDWLELPMGIRNRGEGRAGA